MATTGREYGRLIQVAAIGMVSGVVWQQRSFQIDCQTLAKNAKWWHLLSILEIPFDDSKFRNAKDGTYQRTLIRAIIQKSDLSSAIEFGREYLIEDDFTYLEWIEYLLDPSNELSNYQNLITTILLDVENTAKLETVLKQQCIPKISAYDYDSKSHSHLYKRIDLCL
jgi:Zn-dependent oligopeptidase